VRAALAILLALELLGGPARAEDGGGGVDAGVAIWQLCKEPPAGDVAEDLGDAGVRLSLARASYDACRIGAASKCSELLANVDAGVAAAPVDHSTLHLVSAVVTAAAAIFSGYAANRTARHLGLLP